MAPSCSPSAASCASKPRHHNAAEVDLVVPPQDGHTTDGADHLNCRLCDQVQHPDIAARLDVHQLLLAILGVETRLRVLAEPRVQTAAVQVDVLAVDDAHRPGHCALVTVRRAKSKIGVVLDQAVGEGRGCVWRGLKIGGFGLNHAHKHLRGIHELVLVQHAVLTARAVKPDRPCALDQDTFDSVSLSPTPALVTDCTPGRKVRNDDLPLAT